MSQSNCDWNNWLATISLEERMPSVHPGRVVQATVSPLETLLWRRACLRLWRSRSLHNRMFRQNLPSFFTESTEGEVWEVPCCRGRPWGCVCFWDLSLPLLMVPSLLSVPPAINCWSSVPGLSPAPQFSPALWEVWHAVLGPWCRQKM